jgi:uracil-DNA glycosylase
MVLNGPMALPEDVQHELSSLVRAVRAHLEVEDELGAPGYARTELPPRRSSPTAAPTRVAAPSSPAPVVAAPPAFTALPIEERRARLQVLSDAAAQCTACVLHEGRTRSVFARGSIAAELVFVGEGPGRDEDLQGEPFVGKAGQLLDKMIVAMGYGRDDVYICNVVKCRPPENRTPQPEEASACSQYLTPQLEILAPKVIVALGRCAAQALGAAEATGSWRGRWSSWRGVPLMSTYHPAFLLRSPEFKRTVWEDLQLVMQRLGKTAPKRA